MKLAEIAGRNYEVLLSLTIAVEKAKPDIGSLQDVADACLCQFREIAGPPMPGQFPTFFDERF